MVIKIILLAWTSLFMSEGAVFSQTDPSSVEVDVIRCHDGDTCKVKVLTGGMEFSVRLAGIDAPEMAPRKNCGTDQAYGKESKEFLIKSVVAKKIKMKQLDLDSFNRPVVEFYDESSKNINLEILRQGYAYRYTGKAPKTLDASAYEEAEKIAQNQKLGVWKNVSSLSDVKESPKDFRKRNPNKKCRRS